MRRLGTGGGGGGILFCVGGCMRLREWKVGGKCWVINGGLEEGVLDWWLCEGGLSDAMSPLHYEPLYYVLLSITKTLPKIT